MSFSMSPPAQNAAPYPPYQAASPPNSNQSPYAPPPAKRPRLSPDARTPNGNSAFPNASHGSSNAGYGNPYAQQGVQSPYGSSNFAGSPQGSFHMPQPYQQQHTSWLGQSPTPAQQKHVQISPPPASGSRDMPPPPRPNKDDREEKAGIEDIGDSLFMSGINLKDEENYLHNTWTNRHGNDSAANTQSTSFASSTMTSGNSFNMLTQSTSFGSHGPDGAIAGTMGGPQSQEDIAKELERKREQAARKRAEKLQHHLNNQFLQGNCVRNRMHRLAMENSVRLDVQGVYLRNPEPDQTKVMVDADGKEGIVSVESKPESMIEAGAAYEHILSLISLAAEERLRGLVDEAYGLARARQYGDHGRVVPPEFADIAVGTGKQTQETVIPESVTGTQWDREPDVPSSGGNGETSANRDKSTPQPAETISFQGTLNAGLRELAERDKRAERDRVKKRESRKQKTDNATGDDITPTSATTPAETQAGPAEAAAPIKMSKKEMSKKQKESQAAEAQSFNQSNQTAAMMALGNKKRYSWMTGGSSLPTNRFARPPAGAVGNALPKAPPESAAVSSAAVRKDSEIQEPTWGDWREDSVDGRGIQLRDWVLVLEHDGREKRALQRAVNKLS